MQQQQPPLSNTIQLPRQVVTGSVFELRDLGGCSNRDDGGCRNDMDLQNASCVFGDDTTEHACAVGPDGSLACAAPFDRVSTTTGPMVLRVRVGSGCEANRVYEYYADPDQGIAGIDSADRAPTPTHGLFSRARYACNRRHREASLNPLRWLFSRYRLAAEAFAECVGTFILTLVVTGSVCSAALAGSQVGLWPVAIVCGLGVALAIYCTAAISGAHLNPAMSVAFACVRSHEFPIRKLLPYCAAQLLGAFAAGVANYWIWAGVIEHYVERTQPSLARSKPGSVHTALAFGQYAPNPSFPFWTAADDDTQVISVVGAMCIEAWGTAVMAFVVFAVTHPLNRMVSQREWVPLLIGLTVATLISLYAPLTQAGFNPARDFGPRLVALIAGWGQVAIPGPRSEFWIYLVGPFIGAPLGAAFHDWMVAVAYEPLDSNQ